MKRIIHVIITFLLMMPLAAKAAPVGMITRVAGGASWREKINIPYSKLVKGMVISEGNWIRTGPDGWVELTLNDKSKFTLANNTEFEINSFLLTKKRRNGSFYLVQGKLRASVVKLNDRKNHLTVKSGTAVAGIKGTEFLMLSQGQANVFFGNDGKVDVSGNTREHQPLTAGTMTQNTRGIKPLEPLKVEADTPVAEAREILNTVTAAKAPAEWTDSGKIGDIIARWNINYADYLADSGKYQDALHVLQIAIDLTHIAEIRADAQLERGTVYARFLSNPELALAAYLLVLEEYPGLPQAETALFNTAQILLEMGFNDQARLRFEQYLKSYPQGRYYSTSETLLKNLGK